ncbi:MAG: tRNA 2-thiocytidine(32) synthetase TtcA [Gammaproteobacteria bacterium]
MDLRKAAYRTGVLQQRLRRHAGRAISDYAMVADGDKIMACMSGGKDSHAMLDILLSLQKRAKTRFSIVAVVLDQGHPGFDDSALRAYLESREVPHRIVFQDTFSVVKRTIPEGKTMCGLCSRLRRGILYHIAEETGADRIALGHHADDIMETFFMNMFYGGALKAMPPKLTGVRGHSVIRPLAYCRERDIAEYAAARAFPIIPCNLCGGLEGARARMKKMLGEWERAHPGRVENIFRALGNAAPSHLLDKTLFDFSAAAGGETKISFSAQGETANAVC